MPTDEKQITIEEFLRLYNRCESVRFLSKMDKEQINEALEKKNFEVLNPLYKILLEESKNEEQIVRDFVMTKNRILDELSVDATEIKKKYIERPKMAKNAAIERAEEGAADDLLNNL